MLVGHVDFASYVMWLTDVLESYTSDIYELIEEGNKVSGKTRFHGYQTKELFGCPPTREHAWWYGAPIFTFEDGLIRDLWVLGDVYGLIGRLTAAETAIEFVPDKAPLQ